MLNLQKISKALIRLVLLLLLVQFVAPAFVHVSSQDPIHEKNSYKAQHDSGIALSVLLKENSEEKNETNEKSHFIPAIIDFSFHAIALKQSHTNFYSHFSNEQIISDPLFKLHCVFLI